MSNSSLRVVVVDDHPLVRDSVIKTVGSEDGFEVVGEAGDADTAVETIRAQRPDLAILDISIPGRDGLAVAAEMLEELPDLRVMFLSMHDDVGTLQRALALSAAGYVTKGAASEELREALRTIAAGGSYLSQSVAQQVMTLASGRAKEHEGLTEREREILELLAAGARPGEIANDLFLSVKTVKNHLTSIYGKLGVETGAQAVAKAYRDGLVSPDRRL